MMDIRMPDFDGYKVTGFIRNGLQGEKSSVPVIAISAAITPENEEKGRKAGINHFISKPYSEYELLAIITEVLTNKQLSVKKESSEEKVINKQPQKLTPLHYFDYPATRMILLLKCLKNLWLKWKRGFNRLK
ncbi:MAG: response regulator [Bacteroidales bacterium]|nr:response regulator [Bacteroidales bacterium]